MPRSRQGVSICDITMRSRSLSNRKCHSKAPQHDARQTGCSRYAHGLQGCHGPAQPSPDKGIACQYRRPHDFNHRCSPLQQAPQQEPDQRQTDTCGRRYWQAMRTKAACNAHNRNRHTFYSISKQYFVTVVAHTYGHATQPPVTVMCRHGLDTQPTVARCARQESSYEVWRWNRDLRSEITLIQGYTNSGGEANHPYEEASNSVPLRCRAWFLSMHRGLGTRRTFVITTSPHSPWFLATRAPISPSPAVSPGFAGPTPASHVVLPQTGQTNQDSEALYHPLYSIGGRSSLETCCCSTSSVNIVILPSVTYSHAMLLPTPCRCSGARSPFHVYHANSTVFPTGGLHDPCKAY